MPDTKPMVKTDPAVVWASVFGVGWIPKAPGTWGSVAAVLFWWLLLADLSWVLQLTITTAYFLTGWLSAEIISRKYHLDDAPQIVADEVAGMWLALIFAPKVWWLVGLLFLLFRLLDIAKPGPIGWLDRNVHGGLGVMADDVLAGAVVAVLGVGLVALSGLAGVM